MKRLTSLASLATIALLAGCSGHAEDPTPRTQQSEAPSTKLGSGSSTERPSTPDPSQSTYSSGAPGSTPATACGQLNESCDITGGVQRCCDPKASCMEYTVYDYRRCELPRKAGLRCDRDDQCASNRCGCDGGCCP
jgi:hypothetical protein